MHPARFGNDGAQNSVIFVPRRRSCCRRPFGIEILGILNSDASKPQVNEARRGICVPGEAEDSQAAFTASTTFIYYVAVPSYCGRESYSSRPKCVGGCCAGEGSCAGGEAAQTRAAEAIEIDNDIAAEGDEAGAKTQAGDIDLNEHDVDKS